MFLVRISLRQKKFTYIVGMTNRYIVLICLIEGIV